MEVRIVAIIKDYMNGTCHIIVHDDCIRPPEEVKGIIDRVSAIVIAEELRRHMIRIEAQKGGTHEDN